MHAHAYTYMAAGAVQPLHQLRYDLDYRGIRIQFLAGARDFFIVSKVALGLTKPLCRGQWGAISLGVMGHGCEVDHAPLSTAEVISGGLIPPLPGTSS
jgi:hypothetical protein